MVEIYVDLILKGKKTVDDVPEIWKAEVKKALKALGVK